MPFLYVCTREVPISSSEPSYCDALGKTSVSVASPSCIPAYAASYPILHLISSHHPIHPTPSSHPILYPIIPGHPASHPTLPHPIPPHPIPSPLLFWLNLVQSVSKLCWKTREGRRRYRAAQRSLQGNHPFFGVPCIWDNPRPQLLVGKAVHWLRLPCTVPVRPLPALARHLPHTRDRIT